MAHFARLNEDGIVIGVNVVNNSVITDIDGVEQEALGASFLKELHANEDVYKQTSYNTQGGTHSATGTAFRKNYAGVGFTYDSVRDAFIAPQPYPSWTLVEDTCLWEAPTPYPEDDKMYEWNEDTTSWVEVTEGE